MGPLRLSGELTQSYADRAEVQDLPFLLLPPRPLTQAPPPGPLPGVASAHQTSLITGRRWTQALPFRRRKARPESQGRIASQHCFTLDTSPFFRAPSQDSQRHQAPVGHPQPRGPPGRLTQQKPPSPPGPGAPGPGLGLALGFCASCFVRPGAPPPVPGSQRAGS